MEAEYIRDRVTLWQLHSAHPDWTLTQLAEAVKRSRSWVKKWLRRFREEPPQTHPQVFLSRTITRATRQPLIFEYEGGAAP